MKETMDLQLSHNSHEKLREYCNELKSKITLNDKVLFINSPLLDVNTFEPEVARNRCYYAYPPRGILCLAAEAKERGLKPSVLDMNYEILKRVNEDADFDYRNWMSILSKRLERNDSSVIGVSNIFNAYLGPFRDILKFLGQRDKNIIIVGGHNATYDGKELVENDLCHFVLEREAENKINYLFDLLYEDKKSKPTSGIVFKHDKRVERTEGEKDIVNLTRNLTGVYDLIPLEDYCKVGCFNPYSRMVGKDTPFSSIEFVRGCHGGCKFCGVVDYMGKKLRSRKVEDVLDEIEYLREKGGIKHFELLDDDFAAFGDRAHKVLSSIVKRKLDITWASGNGLIARTVDEKLMEKMRDSGCVGFKIGVESGNPDVLKRVHKPGSIKDFMTFSERVRKFPEMFVVDNYILGFPEETFGQMMDSYNFSLKMNLDWSNFAVYQHNVSFFGNEEERNNNVIGDFIPTKDAPKGKLVSSEKVARGKDIFEIPPETIPSREQLKYIWTGFNLGRNFIGNKNLLPEGRLEKFISWTEAVQERYPTHPYITLFLSFAYSLAGNKELEIKNYEKTEANLKDDYWKKMFDAFDLTEAFENFPRNKTGMREALDYLGEEYGILGK